MTTALSLPPDTELLESLLWQPGQGYFLLERHLERLQQSAKVLGFPCSVQHVRATLLDLEVCFTTPRKVRLLLDDRGLMHMNSEPLKPSTPVRAALAVQAVSRDELLLRHKTTARGIYTDALAAVQQLGVDDVMLWNEQGELTETSTANLVLKFAGTACTPPLACGLLPGTFRAELIANGELEERVLPIEQLHKADNIWLINSVRRWCPVEWVRS